MTREKIKELEVVCESVIEWLQKNACPHDKIIITLDSIEFLKGECGIPVKVLD